jgi:tetratricopeptide (TPR) repeat protein
LTPQLTPPDKEPKRPELQPPASCNSAPQKSNLRAVLLIAFTLFALLDIAIIAYIYLSDKAEKKMPPPPVQEQTRPAPDTAPSDNKTTQDERHPSDYTGQKDAEEFRSHWLQLQAMAEADEIGNWGGTEYTAIINQAAAAEQLLAGQQYQRAKEYFQQVADAVQSLQAARPKLLAEALAGGTDALSAENSDLATKFFTRALTLAPENEQAGRGLARARTLDEVLAVYQKGLKAEEQADFAAAEVEFSQAQQLDSDFLPATQALHRVQTQQKEVAFRQAMGKFLQALNSGKVAIAKTELNRAAQLHPQSSAVQNGNRQLQQLIIQQTLIRLQQEYRQLAASEQWQQAAKRCKQALKIDPQATFALSGLQEARQRLELEKRLQRILDHPERLQEQGPLQEARQTLAQAESVTGSNPELNSQRAAVKKKIEAATRQIPVFLQSDNITEVIIYRVGRLGTFKQRQVQLRPGRYTVVGSRPGYRDVRKIFEIHADDKQALLSIHCTEVI